jgi:hypothetical protein
MGIKAKDRDCTKCNRVIPHVTISVIDLFKELQDKNILILQDNPQIHCKVFEDNSGAIKLAKVPKMRPPTKHIGVKYHHFRSYLDKNAISIKKIDTLDQPADILTKPVNKDLLVKHQLTIMGW